MSTTLFHTSSGQIITFCLTLEQYHRRSYSQPIFWTSLHPYRPQITSKPVKAHSLFTEILPRFFSRRRSVLPSQRVIDTLLPDVAQTHNHHGPHQPWREQPHRRTALTEKPTCSHGVRSKEVSDSRRETTCSVAEQELVKRSTTQKAPREENFHQLQPTHRLCGEQRRHQQPATF